jgi:WhiB family redox-sensing transcriptional regulator
VNIIDYTSLLPSLPEANCREINNPDIFFPVSKEDEANSLEVTKVICGNCMNRKECLEFALSEQIPYGIWAGTSPAERKLLWPANHRAKGMPKVAHRIRELDQAGRSPKQIADLLNSQISYVKKVLERERSAKLKGEIQSQLKIEGLSEGQS